MVYDVTSATEEVAGSVSSCGNFCSLMQNIAVTGPVLFPDAGIKVMLFHASLFALLVILCSSFPLSGFLMISLIPFYFRDIKAFFMDKAKMIAGPPCAVEC